MSFLGIIVGALAAIGAFYVYTIVRGLKNNVKSDVLTLKSLLEQTEASIISGLDKTRKVAADANAGAIRLAKTILENNDVAIKTLKASKNMKGKGDWYPSIYALVELINDKAIKISGVSATASGFKIDIPFGQFSFSFGSNSVKAYKEGAKQFDLTKVKSLLPKK